MHFDAGMPAVTPEQEWLARVSIFLPADNPHQRCILRAREQDIYDVNQVCDCEHAACDKECCR